MPRIRLLLAAVLMLMGLVGVVPASAQADGPVDVIELTGPLDRLAVDFIIDTVEASAARGAEVAIIQLDTPGALTAEVQRLVDLVERPPLPVVVWIGPEPATGYGAALSLLAAAEIGAAAPGVELGYGGPLVAGGDPQADPGPDPELTNQTVVVSSSAAPPYVAIVAATINNLLVELDGRTVTVGDESILLETVEERDGAVVAKQTVFREPGVGVRTLRLAIRPEAAFFFLVAGLTVAAFEFYAVGPGVAAAVAAISLLLSGYGLVVLPLRWWAVGLTLLGMWLLTVDFQRGAAGVLTVGGTLSLILGGLFFTDSAPQIVPVWWAVVLAVISVVLFYMFAMTAVARSRFSTPTLGRDHLIGRVGVAVVDFSPDGEVEVDGGRWPASAHREAGIAKGDEVVIAAVDGRYLEVEPAEPPAADDPHK